MSILLLRLQFPTGGTGGFPFSGERCLHRQWERLPALPAATCPFAGLEENGSGYELICLKGLPSACETAEVNVVLWKSLDLYYKKYILMQQSFGWRYVLVTVENKCAHANLKNNVDYHSPEWNWWRCVTDHCGLVSLPGLDSLSYLWIPCTTTNLEYDTSWNHTAHGSSMASFFLI